MTAATPALRDAHATPATPDNVVAFPVDALSGDHDTKVNDARVSGPDSPEWQALLDRSMTFLLPKNRERDARQNDWKNKTATFREWLVSCRSGTLTEHVERETKGYSPAVFGASAVEKGYARRSAEGMKTVDIIGIDVDSGDSYEAALDRVAARGLACIGYTSFRDGTTRSTEKREAVLKTLKITCDPTVDEIRGYLSSKGKLRSEIIATVEIAEQEHQDENGVHIVLSHAPLEKWRLLFPLAETLTVTTLDPMPRASREVFSRKVRGLASMLDVLVDEACFDVSRVFYLPSHPPGGDYAVDVIRGRALAISELPEVAKGGAQDPFEAAGARVDDRKIAGMPIRKWAVKYAHRLEIGELMQAEAPDKVRKLNGSVVVVECPFDECHSNAGDPADTACHVQNCDLDRGFVWSCLHGCKETHDRLDMLHKALSDGWFAEACLVSGDYLVPLSDEELAVEESRTAAVSAPEADAGKPKNEISAAELFQRFSVMIRDGADNVVMLDAVKAGKKDSGLTQVNVQKLWSQARDQYADELADQERQKRQAAPRRGFVALEQATERSVELAAENAPWLPDFVRYKKDEGASAWFYARDIDNPKEWVRACRAFEVPYIAFGEGDDGKRTNEITIRYRHRSKQRGIVQSVYKIGDTYRDTGSFLSTLVDEGFDIDPQVSAGTIVRLLRSVDTSNEAVLVEKSGWHGDAYVSPSGAVANAGDQRYILNPKARISARAQGSLADHSLAATTALTGATGDVILPGYLSGLAGCLVNFIDHDLSPVISNEGKAKQGKTSAGKMGAAHFGPPDQTGLFGKADATPTAIENLAERGGGAVVVLDEGGASKADSTETQRLILQWADGSGRARGTQSGGIARTRTWKTCFVLSSEIGIVTAMEAAGIDIKTGAVSRVFSVNFDGAPILDKNGPEVAAIRILSGDDKERAVYGVTGVVFADKLAQIGKEAVRTRVSAVETEWSDLARGAGDRVVSTAAILTVAGEIAQEADIFGGQVPVREIMRGLLVATLEAGASHLDTDRQSIDKLRRAIMQGVRTGTIVTMHENRDPSRVDVLGYYGHLSANGRPDHATMAQREQAIVKAYKNGKDGDLLEADEREARVYILPVDRLGKLGITTDPKALADRLQKADALVTRKKGKQVQVWHDYLPGEGTGRNLRVKGVFVHGEDEGDL